MRKLLTSLILAGLLAMATVIPAFADDGTAASIDHVDSAATDATGEADRGNAGAGGRDAH